MAPLLNLINYNLIRIDQIDMGKAEDGTDGQLPVIRDISNEFKWMKKPIEKWKQTTLKEKIEKKMKQVKSELYIWMGHFFSVWTKSPLPTPWWLKTKKNLI